MVPRHGQATRQSAFTHLSQPGHQRKTGGDLRRQRRSARIYLFVRASEKESTSFNPWNLLRAAPRALNRAQGPLGAFGETNGASAQVNAPAPDDWDPADAKDKYKTASDLPFQVALTGASQFIRTGSAGANFGARVAPARADQAVTWSTDSDLVSLSQKIGPSVVVTGQNKTEQAEWVAIKAAAANGIYALGYVHVEPKYIDPPKVLTPPTVNQPIDGKATVDYKIDLGGRPDQSLVSWFLCDDVAGKNALKVAVSRGNQPLTALPLTPGYVGKFLKVTVQPKHRISESGPIVQAFSTKPISASDVTTTSFSPNFRNFVADENESNASGLWTVLGNWRVVPGDIATEGTGAPTTGFLDNPLLVPVEKLVNGYGIRPNGPSSLLLEQDVDCGDMQIDLTLAPEKQGTVFSVPGSPDE